MSKEPEVSVPMPAKYGSPACPICGYRCGCCCYCSCQDAPDYDEDDDEYGYRPAMCYSSDHEPWDCAEFSVRYRWAKEKSERLANGSA